MCKRIPHFDDINPYALNSIGVVDGEFGIETRLDTQVDEAIDDPKGIKLELNTIDSTVCNLLVFFIEVVEELY